MDLPKVMFVVMAYNRWDSLETSTPVRLGLAADPSLGQGFLAVYEDYEEAMRHANGAPVMALEPKRREEVQEQ